jgi:hypothetical protein
MAFDVKPLKHQEHAPTEEVDGLSNSDHSSDKSQLPFQDVQDQQHCYSQDSFGGTSQISTATVVKEANSQQQAQSIQDHLKLLSKPGLTSFFEPPAQTSH